MTILDTLRTPTLFLLLAFSAISCTSDCPEAAPGAVAAKTAKSFAGVWKTSYGDVYFPKYEGNRVRGAFWSYPDSNGKADNGRIIAEIHGSTLTGYWIEDSGDTPCESERDGSYNWGPVHFEANEDFSVISGAWGFCEQQPEGDDAGWVGTRD
jgi:hypothetical protein